jgi:hypothetical protein
MAEPRERLLADKQELLEVLLRYCRAIDRRDYDLLRSVYHPDAVDEHGGLFSGSVDDFIAEVPRHLAPFSMTTHAITNALFHVDGDRAEGESYVFATHVTRDTPPLNIVVSGRYLDRFERRSGEWRIVHRTCLSDWSSPPDGLDPDGPRGQTDRSDPSYRVLSMFGDV